jgi:thioredoxin 1
MVHNVESLEEYNQMMSDAYDKNKLIVVDFYATWCNPCKKISSFLDILIERYDKDKVLFLKVNIEELEDLMDDYDIISLPTLKLFKYKKELETLTGKSLDKGCTLEDELVKYIELYI